MFKFFRIDSPFNVFMTKVGDCILLSLLWLLTSLPLVTLGASTGALYAGVNKVVRLDQGGVWKTYWTSFRSCLKQGTLIALPICLACIFWGLTLSTMASNHLGDHPLYSVAFVLLALAVIWLHYIFAYIARFQDTVRNMLRTTFVIMLVNFPFSLMLLILFAAVFMALWITLPASSVALVILPAVYMLVNSLVMEHIFRKYLPAGEEE